MSPVTETEIIQRESTKTVTDSQKLIHTHIGLL